MAQRKKNKSRLLVQKHSVIESYIERIVIRSLVEEGTLLVREGESVTPADIIGECYISKGFRIIDVSEILEIQPKEVPDSIKKEVGATVFKGEVLGEKKKYMGIVTKQFICPSDGILENINAQNGQLTLRFLPSKMKLLSSFYGDVVEVTENKQVKLRTRVHLVKGRVGMGAQREGVLKILADMHENVSATMIDSDCTNKIIWGGNLITCDLVQKAITLGVKGIIGGGINARDYRSIVGSLNPREDVGISVLILNGFGSSSVDTRIMEMFKTYQNRHVIIDPLKKEFVIPLSPNDEELLKNKNSKQGDSIEYLKIGDEVAIISWPYLGKRGVVKDLSSDRVELGSGIRSFVATVKMDDGKELLLPLQNLELIK